MLTLIHLVIIDTCGLSGTYPDQDQGPSFFRSLFGVSPKNRHRSRRSSIDNAFAALLGPCKNYSAAKKNCPSPKYQRNEARRRAALGDLCSEAARFLRSAAGLRAEEARGPQPTERLYVISAGLRAEEAPEGGLCSEAAQPKGPQPTGALICNRAYIQSRLYKENRGALTTPRSLIGYLTNHEVISSRISRSFQQD
jgi:hypothetical protein